jgi:hypothetical protein
VRQHDAVRERTLEIMFLKRRRGVRVHVRVAELDDWVVVEVASSEPEAELLCSVLRGAGIECLTG